MVRLFSTLWYLVVGEPHAGKAIKSMEKAVAKLAHAADFQTAKAAARAEAARLAQEASEFATKEADKAQRIYKKLSELIS